MSEICDAFERTAKDRSHLIAVAGLGGAATRTFADLAADAAAMRRALDRATLPSSPCVVSAVGNEPAFFAMLLAVLGRSGAVALFDAADRLADLERAGARLGADGLVVPARTAALAAREGVALPGDLALLPIARSDNAWWHHEPARGPVLLKMTSGSSDAPRAVVARERHVIADARHVVEAMDIGPDDVSLAAIPLAHSYGLGNLVLPLLLQGSAIALRAGLAPRQLRDDLAAARVTVLPGVPYLYEHLRQYDLAASVAAVRRLITAGAPIEAETLAYFDRAIGRKVHSFYGSSETGGISFDDSDEVDACVRVGRPLPGVTIELRPTDRAVAGGQVFVRSDAVADGYAFDDPGDDLGAMFTDGGFLTGDLARLDDGALVLAGRVSRFVNVAGRKVDPVEIERVLRGAPDVIEAHVFGVACDRRGEQVVACVRRRRGEAALTELRAFCAARLPPWKVPRQIVEVEAMPRDARGKISRSAIEALFTAARASGG